MIEQFIPVFDAVATLGFVAAVVVGALNYRDSDLESTFWATFVLVATAGALWTGLVTVEWLGIQGELMDALSTSLQAIVIGVFGIGSIGTLAVVEDLKESQAETERRRHEAETAKQEAESRREEAEAAKREAENAREEAETARQSAEALSEALEEKAIEFGAVMDAAADGDFTRRMDPESESEAMTRIAESFNRMLDDVGEAMARIQSFADEVAAASEKAAAGAGETREASADVSEAVQRIAADAEEQDRNLGEVASEMQGLSGAIEEVASSANQMAQVGERNAELGETGRAAASDAIREMDAIEDKADEATDEVETLAEEIARISEITDVIADIADQTNMLALNASIEAARAGEAGAGFAVVADDIKQLANETASATGDIEDLVADIESAATDTVADMHEMGERVTAGSATVEEALAALEEISENVTEANSGIQEISDATDDQAASAEEVASMIDETAAMANGMGERSNEASAFAEEQTASLAQVEGSVKSLADQAEELQDLLGQFVLRTDATAAAAGSQPALSDGGPSG